MPDKYTLRPTDLGSPKDDFVFRFNGRDVGRTHAVATLAGLRSYWSIYGINLHGPLPLGVEVQGLADDLEAAKATFKTNWEKLLAAGGSVRHIHRNRSAATGRPDVTTGSATFQ
jgi:hypothetical protein